MEFFWVTLVTSCTSNVSRYFFHNIFPFLFLVSYIQACLQPFCKQISSLTPEALSCINQVCCNIEIGVLSSLVTAFWMVIIVILISA